MRKFKLFFACLLMAVLSIGQVWATDFTLSSAASVTKEGITVSFAKGSGGTAPTWYAAGLRLYASNTVTITCENDITDVTFNWEKQGSKAFATASANVGSYTHPSAAGEGTWSGTAKSITFTLGSSGQLQLNTLSVTIDGGGSEPSVSLTPSSLNLDAADVENQSVTITTSNFASAISSVTTGLYSDAECTSEITSGAWVKNVTVNGEKTAVTFDVDDNNTGVARECWLMVAASDGTGNASAAVHVAQKKIVVDYATLPFSFTGGRADIETTDGMTQNGLGTDYSATEKLKFDGTGDWLKIKINADPGKLSYQIKGNTFSGGTFTIQQSADDETYSDLATYTADGSVELALTKTTRYVKFIYTSKSSGNIGLGNIAISLPVDVEAPTISGVTPFLSSTEVTLTQNDADAIYYTTNDDDPTTGSTLYEGPFELNATATVKAIAVKGGVSSAIASATFTKATVMTVAQALAASTGANQYVKGVILNIEEVSTGFGNATYYLKDEGQENSIKIYRGKYLNNEAFTAEDQIIVGDEVTVFGTISQYQNVNQFAQGNYIVALKPAARLSWEEASFMAELEGQNTFPTLTNTNGVTVTYSSSNTNAATVDPASGEITLKAVGTTTITASFAGNDQYKANSASYTLNVQNSVIRADISFEENGGSDVDDMQQQTNLPSPLPTITKAGSNFGGWWTTSTFEDGTEAVAGAEVGSTAPITLYAKWNEPYTVAQARAAIDAGKGITGVYAKGIVSEIVTAYNSQYGNISYNISADGLTTSDQLQAYRGFDKDGAWFTSADDVQVGDEVVVYGNLKKYNSTYEFDQNNQRYSFSRPAPKYTVRFWNSEGWDNVYAYVWDNTQAYEGDWPGLNITSQIEDGWNYYQIEEGRNIIFTAGNDGPQTVDIENVQANVCYVLTGETVNTSLVVAADNDCDDRFYIQGNEALTGKDWKAIRLVNGSITFENVAASNDLQFKINNGNWAWNRGKDDFDSDCSNVTIWTEQQDGNIGFETDEAKNITISYDKAADKVCVQAVKYVAPVYKAIVVSYGGKHYAMTKTAGNSGFAPLEVTVDDEGNVAVNNEDEKTSILWKFNGGTGTATFQSGTDYLAGANGTNLNLQAVAQDWTLDADNEYYYVMDGTTKRSFFYQTNDNGGIFKNYAVSNFEGEKYSGKHTLYAADKVVIRAKVRFFAPVAWENVYAHTWGGTDNGDHQMTAVEEGSRWFEGTIEKGVDFLFYNGTWEGLNQTDDQTAINENKCFAWSGVATSGKYAVTEIASCEMNYYLAGDDALLGTSGDQGWAPDARALNDNNSITFNEVAANTQENPYKFKITNGTWNWNLGAAYVDQTACSGVTIEDTDGDGNAVFSIDTKSNITITYNPATEKISIVAVASTPEILVDKAEIAFGTVDYEDAVDAEIINVTLISVANATISLTGDVDAFQLDKDALTASGIVSVTPVTTTAGTFNATLTISDAATAAEAKEITLSLTVNEAPVVDDITGTWRLVTDASQLVAGKKVIIASIPNEGAAVTLSMNQAQNNRTGLTGATVSEGVITAQSGTAVFTIAAGTEENTIAFKSSADEYLYAASSSKNYMRSQAENDANGSWIVEIAEGVATITAQGSNSNKRMRYNPNNNSPIFSCYATTSSTGTLVTLYMLEEEEPEPQYETIRENLEPNRYYTICMEKNITAVKNATFWNLRYKNTEPATEVYLEETTTIEAGKPYIFQAGATTLDVIYGADSEDAPVENGALRGTFEDLTVSQLAEKSGVIYLLIQNAIRPNDGNYLNAHRAYIDYSALTINTLTSNNAPGKRVRAIPMHQDAATGIDELNASEKPVKMVIDGQLYIIRGEKMYDATGRLVK